MDLTILATTALTAAINGVTVFIACRYAGKLADKIEKKTKEK